MKRFRNLFVLTMLISGLIFIHCSESNPVSPGQPGLPRLLSKSESDLISSDNKFGFKLFKEIVNYDRGKNVFISPLSVGLALGMTYNGAGGTTREAMHATLELQDLTLQEVNEAYQSLMELLLNLDPKVQFQIANSIWYRQDFSVEQEFIDLNKTFFNAEVASLDFSDPGAVDIINGWISDNTNGKIKEMIDSIGRETVMFLINALYFKGTWTYEFNPENTKDDLFNLSDGTQKPCRMMTQEGSFYYYENENFQVVDLPYGVGDFSMTIFLPQNGITVDDVITSFNQENWDQWMSRLSEQDVKLYLPKFKLEYKLKMNDVLKALGMEIAFSDAADFTGINPSGGLFISKVLHNTYVDVNEEGTEAAAVTVVEIGKSLSEGHIMLVDSPFIFMIRERYSGTILFAGKVIDPVL